MVYICKHLGYIDDKCYHIQHTWILWVLVYKPTYNSGGPILYEAMFHCREELKGKLAPMADSAGTLRCPRVGTCGGSKKKRPIGIQWAYGGDSLDWFKKKSTGNHVFTMKYGGYLYCNFPFNQSNERYRKAGEYL